jgi:hypothetical protein
MSSVIPCWRPKIFATRLLVCPVSKATRTSSHARRASLERIRLSIAVSMIGVRSSLYCMFTLFWRACLRKAAPVLETVRPSCSAIRCSSRLTMGSTHKVRCTVFRLGLGLFFDRVAPVFNECGRGGFRCGAGCCVPVRADEIRPLSCLTAAFTASGKTPFDWL